ncbi:uncharacterized protein NFIA_064800 [Aspergillus fischeri NRRL 181]|uniref:CBF1-interacting co-repressor CIR N-terminal domain-containing protein n=1 Tax=Neosartorya fischeri (strain ATCC 1020 / DSM 3700 / CBS 544.65 / FGSC A1164 / JCM 1740 / NRRL 181 / WB 181) TaxID=331117 RepID=A1D6H2_NEOFI|nr:conserved hypothetical protein [Aspergillus fischeri NRRL 181]EAW21316.1 conserved hypothetical protein [Aspergillus fischeri NRRL 181]
MPLHLLGKKSWNVYNPENIARVRRDEAEAKAREEEEERRMQEIDAERRIQILRGEQPSTPPPPPSAPSDTRRDRTHGEDAGRYRKRRRLAGENDTDRDIRLAREDAQLMLAKSEELAVSKTSDAPLLDSKGHINLFPSEAAQKPAEKNKEAEKEAADKNRSYEDQYTMRFSNAAGYRQSAGQMPWYSSSSRDVLAPDAMPEKDVWGNEDPMRQEREKARLDANDPLAAIKRGVRQLKSVELGRKKWNQERKRELDALKEAERHRIGNRGAHTDIARIAAEEGATVLTIILAINPASDTVTPIPTPIRTVIVIPMTMTEGTFTRRSRTDAMCDTFRYGSLILM